MKSDLKIFTSFVSPFTLEELVKDDYLPVFILRSIGNSRLIGKYSGTSIHLRELSPSQEIFRARRDEKISWEEYKEKYIQEMTYINLNDIVRRLENLALISDAKGVVLLGYGGNPENCHRSILKELLNNSGLLKNEIIELEWNLK